jgi:hypothetical protein
MSGCLEIGTTLGRAIPLRWEVERRCFAPLADDSSDDTDDHSQAF